MRTIKSIMFTLAAVLTLGSCESDLEKITYNADDAVAAVISPLEDSYILDVMSGDKTAIIVEWEEADFGYSASVSNIIEMDISGGDFSSASTLASLGMGTKKEITHSEVNNAIAKLFANHNIKLVAEPFDFEIRIRSKISNSAPAIISNIVSTSITPYDGEREYASIALRGDYNGWDFDNSQRLYSKNDDENYSGMIYFDGAAANGWKLCADSSWSMNWGVDGTESDEQESMTLVSGGDNFMIYARNSYLFEFNSETLKFTMSKPHDSWGIVGSINEWGASDDIEMILSSEDNTFFIEATLEFTAGDEWKIRADNDWGDSIGCGDVNIEEEYMSDSGNFKISESGSYTIKWFFNKVEQNVEIIKI